MDRRELLQAGLAGGLLGLTISPLARAVPRAESDSTLWLNWNENPLGLSPAARDAASLALESAHRYPDMARAELASQIAERHGIGPRNIVLGCGSTQILRAVVAAEAGRRELLVLAEPTFEAVVRYQQPFPYQVVRIPLDRRYAHDLPRMRKAIGSRPALIYLCNPNNPTATLTPSAEIDAWIREAPGSSLFVIDEAYFEYVEDSGYWSAAKWVRQRPNLVVTRTFSKIYAMAGLRLGYGLAHEDTALRLRSFLSIDNLTGVAIAAAQASLRDKDLLPKSRDMNRAAGRIVKACLDELGIEYLPTHTNFLMHRVEGDLEAYIERMRERRLRVGRPFPPMLEFNRLTLGLPTEMERWAETLREFRARGWV